MPLYIIKENIRQNNKEHTARLQSTHHKTIKNIQQKAKKNATKGQKGRNKTTGGNAAERWRRQLLMKERGHKRKRKNPFGLFLSLCIEYSLKSRY